MCVSIILFTCSAKLQLIASWRIVFQIKTYNLYPLDKDICEPKSCTTPAAASGRPASSSSADTRTATAVLAERLVGFKCRCRWTQAASGRAGKKGGRTAAPGGWNTAEHAVSGSVESTKSAWDRLTFFFLEYLLQAKWVRKLHLSILFFAAARRNNFPPLPSSCPLQPCFYQDFTVDIPLEFQKIVRIVYYLWLGMSTDIFYISCSLQ